MFKTIGTAILTVTLTVFLTPLAERAYTALEKPGTARTRREPVMHQVTVKSSVVEAAKSILTGGFR
ncbi:MAG: hypothetical protein KC897_11050 [Candidatus Omnitrophica bacterium]|nr:hypothetical protein [Candidatus Omnitrophota bacterium]